MDASVGFLLDNLKQLIKYHANLVAGAEGELEQLNVDLNKFKAILTVASKLYKKNEIFKAWERNIREVVYDIEDTIDTCVTRAAGKKSNHLKRLFSSKPATLAEAVKSLRKVVQPLLAENQFHNFTIADAAPDATVAEAREIRQKKTQNIVGFQAEAEDFINFLNTKSSKLEVRSILGMAGLGKTTLAWKIFEDSKIKYEFPVRIWVNVTDDLNMKNVLLTILRKFNANPQDIIPEENLIKMVKDHLKKGKFLIVMDDVWTISAWEKIKEILPRDNFEGRVLVTSRNKDVAEHSSSRNPHYLRFLTAMESWQLLQYEVFGKLGVVPNELEGIGQVIATDCDGLPLSIVVIGGILVEKKSRAGNHNLAIRREWEEVSSSVKPYLVDGDKKKLLSSIISLSYEKLPYELRNCFLYLGVFPEDANIPVKELIRLWIAEGFILESGRKSLEQVALDNLKELINRNLVMVKEAKLDGEPKICHIHDSVREICKTESKYENLNLFQDITRSDQGGFVPCDNIEKCRRLCIHTYVVEFMKKTKKVPKARSFLCFHQTSVILKTADMACITDSFGLLRVYDAKNIKFPKFPQKFVQLIHLRYLTLVLKQCTSLPEVISQLWNLQTLIVDVLSSTLDIKANVLQMRNLRHFKTKASITLKGEIERGEGCENLQTLSRLSPKSCTREVFNKAKNLITLGIQGELNMLTSSNYLGNLDRLHKLKLVNEVPNRVAAENPLRRLPPLECFPPNLKILVLSGTYMNWTMMSTLSMLGFLEVLKLKENAFTGHSWEAAYVYPRLEILHIERSTELVSWKVTTDHPFPKLKFLLLNNCEKLIQIPSAVCENLECCPLNVSQKMWFIVPNKLQKTRKGMEWCSSLKLLLQTISRSINSIVVVRRE